MKIGILGYGKMGKVIDRIAQERGHEVVARNRRGDSLENLKSADVVIEFSSPESVMQNLEYCLINNLPTICGTTGWNESMDTVKTMVAQNSGSLVHASNFSLGVNLFFELNQKLAAMMAPFDNYKVQLQEIHHTEKKDAPSGTAISIAQGIIEETSFSHWHLGTVNEQESIGIEALRQEDVKGTHVVNYNSEIDQLQIKHTAHSRDGFALGAIIAAEWIIDRKGIFTMKNVLGL
jgi:4-hydroxy-tetrahydrodipicolinate reductase